jgi:Sphingolipid Delta4-desaturase (DES)
VEMQKSKFEVSHSIQPKADSHSQNQSRNLIIQSLDRMNEVDQHWHRAQAILKTHPQVKTLFHTEVSSSAGDAAKA